MQNRAWPPAAASLSQRVASADEDGAAVPRRVERRPAVAPSAVAGTHVPRYKHPMVRPSAKRAHRDPLVIERVQTGVRLEKRLLKVLKALAEYHDLSLG